MVVIAVAGGTGGVGKTIVEQLQQDSKHQIVVLSRSERKSSEPGLQYVQVNYEDTPSLVKVLEDNKIHTVISTIAIHSDETSQSQLNLIQAAEEAKVTERFIPSEWGVINTPELAESDPMIKWWVNAAEALKKSNLKYTRFVNGFFMDYWGMPHVKTNLELLVWSIDLANKRAAIPGDGNNVMSFTYSVDTARHVVKALERDEWPEFSIVVGEDMTFNQFLKLGEELRGSKFEVTYDSVEKLQAGNPTVLPQPEGSYMPQEILQMFGTFFGMLVVNDLFHMPKENRLNEKYPEMKPTITLTEFLTKAWAGR